MRIVAVGDLHYRPTRRNDYLALADQVRALEPDCLLLVGDIGHPLRLFVRGLQLFADLPCPRLLVAGNHDVYRGELDSRTLWEQALPQAARDAGFVWLEDEVVTLPLDGASADDGQPPSLVGICGTLAWYDYSSACPALPYSGPDYRLLKHLVNHDADYVDWPWSDVAMARYLARRFAGRLQRLQDDPAVRQIVVATHVPIFAEAVPVNRDSALWSLLRAYMGNFTLGELVRQASKVTHVVSGHIHRPGWWQVEGAGHPIDVYLVGTHQGMACAVVLEVG